MATNKLLAPNGSLKAWNVGGIDVLFPEQTVLINGEEKLRGNAPVCCPIFSKMPATKDYEGLNIPQHGLVRLGNKHTRLAHMHLGTKKEICKYFSVKQSGWEHYEHYSAHFDTPWKHTVTIVLETANNSSFLSHILLVHFTPQDKTGRMPISACLHPYFSTQGEAFTIFHDHTTITSEEIREGVSISVNRVKSKLHIHLSYGIIIIDLPVDSAYTHFNVWTDCIKKYICVEPYFGLPKVHYLQPEQTITGHCYMHFIPN